MSDAVIEFNGVWKKFARGERFDSLRDAVPALLKWATRGGGRDELQDKEFWALRDVSFRLQRGEALGIMGPNGSGKTTTLKLLSRILKPNRGSITVKGRLGALIELGAGFHPDLTGRENIYLNGTILGMTRAEIAAKFDEIVEFSDLKDFLDTPVKRYSSGMYARLGFSVAAHINPDVLFIDEVLSVGDYHFQQKCFKKMKEFVENGTSLVFVSHDLTAMSSLCKTGLLMRKGEPVYQGPIATCIQKYHSFYETEMSSSDVELIDVQVRGNDGQEREAFHPGEHLTLEVKLRALKDVPNSYPGMMIHTLDGKRVFLTATSRLHHEKLNLKKNETATVTFDIDLNLNGDVFHLGFMISSEVEVADQWIYYNPRLKKIVVASDHKSVGAVHLNPRAELRLHRHGESAMSAVSASGAADNVVSEPI